MNTGKTGIAQQRKKSAIGNWKSAMVDSLTYMQLLRRNQSFRRLWFGQVISELGNWFNFIAALGLVRVVSHAAPEVTTLLLICRLVPFTLFSPLAGAFVDRWSRRTVMIATDLLRVAVALGFLLVKRPEDLWIAYVCTALLSFFGTFFEAAKNAAVPNITGERDLLAGNALMFSSRFLLMSLGAALGGWTSSKVGYSAAFIINALSFVLSAYSVWLVPDEETRQKPSAEVVSENRKKSLYSGYWSDIREGWSYIVRHAPVATILLVNIVWATGGGAINLIVGSTRRVCVCGREWNQCGFGDRCVVLRERVGLVRGDDDRASRRCLFRAEAAHDRLYRLEFVRSGNFLCADGLYADVAVGVVDAVSFAGLVGRGVCGAGDAADAFGA